MNYTKKHFHFLFTSLLFWLPGLSGAQNYLPYIQKFSLEDGLSSLHLSSFLQDSRGLVWLGTSYGINRYDGATIKNYTKDDDGLCHNYIRVLPGYKGWIGKKPGDYF